MENKENQNIEWKETWRNEYIKWIAGFANAQGGIIYIGKNDNGEVTGLQNARELLEIIPNQVQNILGILVDVNLKQVNDKEYIEIKVENYPSPISYKGQYYFRSGSTKQELKGAALEQFLMHKQGRHWDAIPVPNVNISDFDPAAFDKFRKMAMRSGRMDESILHESKEEILENLMLTENQYVKKAGVLLFHQKAEYFIPGSYIKIGFFQDDAELVYQDEIHGNLFQQAEKTIDILLTKYLKAYISYSGIQRIERFLFPKEALREALLNAIIHKDYSSGIPIQISVYEDKIYFWNDGCLPDDWTIERLLDKHPSKPHNPLIANAFFRAGLIESWGRGIKKIQNECQKNSNPAPVFKYETSGLMLMFKSSGIISDIINNVNDTITDTNDTVTAVNDIVNDTITAANDTVNQDIDVQNILLKIEQNPNITKEELAITLQKSVSTISRKIAKLKANGVLVRIGSKKSGYWKKNNC